MDNNQVRLHNLLKLLDGFRTDKDFCQAVGISNTYLPQVKNGGKRLGDLIARRMEQALGLEHGWMDHLHEAKPAPPDASQPDLQTIAAVNAMQAIPAPLRDQIRRTIFMIAATCYPLANGSQDIESIHIERRTLAPEDKKTGTG